MSWRPHEEGYQYQLLARRCQKTSLRRFAGPYVCIADFPHSDPMCIFIIFSPLRVPETEHLGPPKLHVSFFGSAAPVPRYQSVAPFAPSDPGMQRAQLAIHDLQMQLRARALQRGHALHELRVVQLSVALAG